jgi:hypothetical protein
MWILNFVPHWIFSLLFFLGIAGFLVTKTVKLLPYRELTQYASVALIFFSTYMVGAQSNDDAWRTKVQKLEQKAELLETKSEQANTNIATTLTQKQQKTQQSTKTIVEYVDREIVKYDPTCVVPKEVLDAHNKAAK